MSIKEGCNRVKLICAEGSVYHQYASCVVLSRSGAFFADDAFGKEDVQFLRTAIELFE